MGELVFKIKKEELSKCDTFSKKLKWLFENNHISNEMNLLLSEINSLRNKLAHRLSYRITPETLLNLLHLADQAGIDFSDEGIYVNE